MKMLQHPNVIQYYGTRAHPEFQCIFLEYASGGELFDQIGKKMLPYRNLFSFIFSYLEPDVGVPIRIAQRYFQQLITGVEYIHSKGICHRDIKPENLLLDAAGKLIDHCPLSTM